MKFLNKILFFFLLAVGIILIQLSRSIIVSAEINDTNKATRVDTSNTGSVTNVAPGELLPISIKLSNFGGGKRVDVTLTYSIVTSTGEEIISGNETVAVETTASFVKKILIPSNTDPGTYYVKTSASYQGQLVPATTQFSFEVERKILGVFQSDFFLYAGLIIFFSILMFVLGRTLIKHRNITRFAPLDYSNIPNKDRVFYELISDTIMGMRQRVGDTALDIAVHTDGLVIDEKTGRVLKFTQSPSKVVAQLVSGYEEVLDQKVSFIFRKTN